MLRQPSDRPTLLGDSHYAINDGVEEMLTVVVDTHLPVEKLMHYAHNSVREFLDGRK